MSNIATSQWSKLAWAGLVFAMCGIGLYGYLNFDTSAKIINQTSNRDVAEALVRIEAIDAELNDVRSQRDAIDLEALRSDKAKLILLVTETSKSTDELCTKIESAAEAPKKVQGQAAEQGGTSVVAHLRKLGKSLGLMRNFYDSMEGAYLGGQSTKEPGAALVRELLQALGAQVEYLIGGNRYWADSSEPTLEDCADLKTNKLLDANTSPMLDVFARIEAKQMEARRQRDAKAADLEGRRNAADAQAKEAQSHLETSPQLLIAKHLPLAMGIILLFGVLLFLAARFVPEAILQQLVESGQLIQFPTVVILFAVILVLALSGGLTTDHTATLLAAVAGYILGTHTQTASDSRMRQPIPGDKTRPTALASDEHPPPSRS